MSAAHQPFPIADVETGMYQAKEPWLSPNNAFQELNDAHVFRSRIHRRVGFSRLSSCGVASTSGMTRALGDSPTIAYTLDVATRKFVPESIALTWNDPVNGNIFARVEKDSFSLQDFGALSAAPGYAWSVIDTVTEAQIGYVTQPWVQKNFVGASNQRAECWVYWGLHSLHTGADAAHGSMTWSEDPELPIVGLASYKSSDGTEFLAAMNTTRLFVYNTVAGWFDDLTGVDDFTGTESDLFWTWPLDDDLLVTNGVDRVKRYDGPAATLTNMGTTIGAGPNVIDTARAVAFYRNRVLYFGTTEGGNLYPRRMRFSGAGAYETLAVQDFIDAPTELGVFVTVQFIADRIMVGFQKGWMELVYTGDSQQLFLYEKTTSIYGAVAKNGNVPDGERILSRTLNGIEALDPNQQYPADVDIPDYVVGQLDNDKSGSSFGTRNIPLKQIWWTVASPIATTDQADQILVAQYSEDKSLAWSVYKIPFNCFAEFRSESGADWDDIDINWDNYEGRWDSAKSLQGFPVVLAGHSNGIVYRAGSEIDHLSDRPFISPFVVDSASVGPQSIPLEIKSERLSPFPGSNAHLGWVDFFLEASSDVTITVEFRGNSNLSAYKMSSFTMAPNGMNEKLYRRLKVNKSALFHTITVKATGGGAFAIDAIIPWFRQAGRMRNFG